MQEELFEMRLVLKMGRLPSEIRSIPYPYFRKLMFFSQLEPFGWHDREDRTARILSMLHNVNVSKKKNFKSVSVYIRNMPALLLAHYRKLKRKPEFDLSTEEGRRKATERAVQTLKRDFGAKDAR